MIRFALTICALLLACPALLACCGKGPDTVDPTPAANKEARWGYIRVSSTGAAFEVTSISTYVNFQWNAYIPFAVEDAIVRVRIYRDGPGDGNGMFENGTIDPLVADLDAATLGLPSAAGSGGIFQQNAYITFPLTTPVAVPASGGGSRGFWLRLQIAATGPGYQDARDVQLQFSSFSAGATTNFGLSYGSTSDIDLEERIFYPVSFGVQVTVLCPGYCPPPGADCAIRADSLGVQFAWLIGLVLFAAGVRFSRPFRGRSRSSRGSAG